KEELMEDDEYETPKDSDQRAPQRGRVHIASLFEESLLDSINDEVTEYRRVLIVANTVPRAVRAYKKINQIRNDIVLLHSRLIRITRERRESRLHEIKKENGNLCLIATQVVEAGLDISFDLVISEMAPIEPLLQRLGRAARRKGERGVAIICNYEGYPYREEVIEAAISAISSPKDVEVAVTDLKSARELIDNQYKELANDIRWESVRAVLGDPQDINILKREIWNINPLRPPIDSKIIRAREDVYVTLLLPDKELLSNLSQEPVIELKKAHFDKSFNVRFSVIRGKRDPFYINGKGPWEVRTFYDPESKRTLWRVIGTDKIRPWRTYILNPNFYLIEQGYELGLVSFKEGEK
ncbi:MAG: CRISPR-associated helicase Cas3', partial [Thermoproteota archaeon]